MDILLQKNFDIYICVSCLLDNKSPKCNNCALEKQIIINIIRGNQMIKQKEITNMINRSLRTVKTRMNEMQEKGFIARKTRK